MAKINGKYFAVYADGTKIADTTLCTLTVNNKLQELDTQNETQYSERGHVGYDWSVTANLLWDESNSISSADIIDGIIASTKYDILFVSYGGSYFEGEAYLEPSNINTDSETFTAQSITYMAASTLTRRGTKWVLPSKDEMTEMLNYDDEIGFDFFLRSYWTSSEDSATDAIICGFSGDPEFTEIPKSETAYIRPIRTFFSTTFSEGDTGPGGGIVFYVSDGTCMEAYTSDLTPRTWSNITNVLVGTSEDLGDGLANTEAILAQSGHTGSAAKSCDDLN